MIKKKRTIHKKKKGVPEINLLELPSLCKEAATYFPACAVSSALPGLTSLFGMGRGGTPVL